MLILFTAANSLPAQGTAFTYQGQLSASGSPANGDYDFTFALFNNSSTNTGQVGSTLTNLDVGVTNGLFTVLLDFSTNFPGASRWLAISVRSNGVGSYTALTPLQELTPAPYAVFASTASNLSGTLQVAQLSGVLPLAQLPGGLVTNNESGVTLDDLTLGGNFTLPLPATVYAGANSVLLAPGNNNFYAGPSAGISNGSGGANTGLGGGSLQSNTNGTNNTAIGYQTLFNNTNGSYNVAIGERTMFQNTSGNDNTADGRHALEDNTVGNDNTANGYQALSSNTSGSQNTADGASALSSSTGGSNNIALGYQAGSSFAANESSNIVIGNPGVPGDNNTVRLGSGQTSTFIAGVIYGDGGGLTNLSASQLDSGTVPLAQLPAAVVTNHDAANVTLSGTFSGDGAALTGINAATLGGLSSAAFWNINGNAGANPTNGAFLGTTDNNPLEIQVDGTRGLRMEPDSRGDSVPTLIGGYSGNAVLQPNSGGDFIAGGGFASIPNLIYSNSSGVFIGAGSGNQVGPNVNDAVLGGGHGNTIQSPDSVVGGGVNNSVATNAQYAFVGGGLDNTNTAYGGTVGGGAYNYSKGTTYGYSTVSGGQSNTSGSFATVGGGYGNVAGGFGSFIGGGGYDGSVFVGNSASGIASVIGGGINNSNIAKGGTIGGGTGNYASGASYGFSTVAGGNLNTSGSFATVGGGFDNTASGFGSFIGGGGFANNTVTGANTASGQASAIVGGLLNTASGPGSFIGGGGFAPDTETVTGGNTASGEACAVVGGLLNNASGLCSFIGGGGIDGSEYDYLGNSADGGGDVIGGGVFNLTENLDSTVGGGYGNTAIGNYSVVPGGEGNNAQGTCSFAGGNNATANYQGTFVWSDNTGTLTQDDGEDQFVVRATGGFWFYTTTSNTGAHLDTGATSWTALSDRNAKKDIEPEDCQAVLNKLAQVPISRWHYNWEAETNTPHIGPMAQDFKHAFYPGRDDKGITTLEFDGVELAAIQGLNQKVDDKEARIQQQAAEIKNLKRQNDSLAARLNGLEAAVKALAERK